MKISIITIVYNNKKTIKDAIESVLNQTYKNIEYIIVDGASTDGTVEIIKNFEDKIDKFISEPDNGIYDAMNKGILNATGDIVGFLHSDDLLADKYALEKIADTFLKYNVDSVYGDLIYVKKMNLSKIVRFWKSGDFNCRKLKWGWMPPHPTFYVKRGIYEKYGLYNTQFKIAADYDLILRFLGTKKISTYYIPDILVKMRVGGKSNKNLYNLFQKSKEDLEIIKKNDMNGVITLLFKNISKVPQLFPSIYKIFQN